MLRPLLATALVALPLPALAQQAETGRAPDRVRSVTLTSDGQACPESTAEEIVVCTTINPDEQFRIPKQLRDTQEVAAQNQSWVNRAATVDQVGRVAGGLPNTCSAVGNGGWSGCNLQLQRDFAAERKAAERNDALVPGGDPADD